MDTEYLYVRSNNNSQVNEQTDCRNNCSETANSLNCGSHEQSQPTLEPLTITQQEYFQTMKPLYVLVMSRTRFRVNLYSIVT